MNWIVPAPPGMEKTGECASLALTMLLGMNDCPDTAPTCGGQICRRGGGEGKKIKMEATAIVSQICTPTSDWPYQSSSWVQQFVLYDYWSSCLLWTDRDWGIQHCLHGNGTPCNSRCPKHAYGLCILKGRC